MSYCSENRLPISTPISRLVEAIELLGYVRVQNKFKIENSIAQYVWTGNENAISFVGIELGIYKEKDCISVQTRTRAGRSYWDLGHQNKTISLLKSLFRGTFTTDEGTNQYMRFDIVEPPKIACALFKCRWIFNYAMIKPKLYLDCRNLTGNIAKEEPTGFSAIDELNPRFLSNNMIIPYLIGCWEAYYRNSFISILSYDDKVPGNALRNCRVSSADLLSAVRNQNDLTSIVADSLSFQRPGIIAENFRTLNSQIDISSWLRKPYNRRKITLFDSITELVEMRDQLVHTGATSLDISDKRIERIIKDLNAAVDRVYEGFGRVYGFKPSYDF